MAIGTHPEELQEQASSADKGYQVLGTRPIRRDGTDKVTGRALYGADLRLPGTLYGAVLRSPHAHARIVSIDDSKATAGACPVDASLLCCGGAGNPPA